MIATLVIPELLAVRTAEAVRVHIGTSFQLHLDGVVGRVRWGSEDNDEVLAIRENDGPVATIAATATGKTTLVIRNRAEVLRIPVEVFRSEATHFVVRSVGPEVLK